MAHSRKILLLSYYWPPAGGPGVQRWLKLSSFLLQEGYSTTVITPRHPVAANYDASLAAEVPAELRVIKTAARDPFKWYQILRGRKGAITTGGIGLGQKKASPLQKLVQYLRANFFIPDARKGWNHFALPAAQRLLRQEDFAALITTGPPHSTHLMGLALKDEFNIPWLADFRDPWVNIFYNQFFPRTARTRRKDQRLEDRVLAQADLVLTISPGMQAEFGDRAQDCRVLYNGYDPKDIPIWQQPQEDIFSLAYTGNFKPNQNLKTLWQVIADLRSENAAFAQKFRLQFTGNVDPGVQADLEAAGLSSCTDYLGYRPHAEATKAMVQAVLLLFVVPQTKDNHLILTGKIFEYLGSGTPLLAIGPAQGNAAGIIAETERGKMLDYDHAEAMRSHLLHCFAQWQKEPAALRQPTDKCSPYTRAGAAHSLAQMIEQLQK